MTIFNSNFHIAYFLENIIIKKEFTNSQVNLKTSLGAHWYSICLPVQEMQVQSLDQEGPLEKGNGNLFQHSCLGNPWTEKPSGLQSMGSQKSQIRFRDFNNWWLSGKESAFSTGDMGSIPGLGISSGEGNGNSLQYSCLFSN